LNLPPFPSAAARSEAEDAIPKRPKSLLGALNETDAAILDAAVIVKTETEICFCNVNPANSMAMVVANWVIFQGVKFCSTKTKRIASRSTTQPYWRFFKLRILRRRKNGSLIVVSPQVKFDWETFPRALAAFKIASRASKSGDTAGLPGRSAVCALEKARSHFRRDPGASHAAA
jgi:hypothetical protein